MNTLIIIDPQNDFCDIPGAALPIIGADADMRRLASFIRTARSKLSDLILTLDSQPTVAFERVTFWKTRAGKPPAPFTEITAAQVRAGEYLPRDPTMLAEVLAYLDALEASGRYRLMVWTVHCVVGTPGHNIHPAVAQAIAEWEECTQRGALKVLKGTNPYTEQYSAVRAEVPRADDPSTQRNPLLVERTLSFQNRLFVAGEASSHCVPATFDDLFAEMTPEQIRRVVFLKNCMSPVPGFAANAEQFFDRARALGAQVMNTTEALALVA
jgi:nicotinamidase-related amidase